MGTGVIDAYRTGAKVQISVRIRANRENIAKLTVAHGRVDGAERAEELEIELVGVACLLWHSPDDARVVGGDVGSLEIRIARPTVHVARYDRAISTNEIVRVLYCRNRNACHGRENYNDSLFFNTVSAVVRVILGWGGALPVTPAVIATGLDDAVVKKKISKVMDSILART